MPAPWPRRWTVDGRPVESVEPLPRGADLVGLVLARRLPPDTDGRDAFLSPSLDRVPDPLRIDGMPGAVDAVARALARRDRILVHGDYDADGVTATALLVAFLRSAGADVAYHIPDRLGEGYGLSERSVEVARTLGARLVVTVDCGVSALDEIAALKAAGIAVVVTDHHVCKERLPEADAVVDPKWPQASYGFDGLSGAGLALRLTQALSARLGLGDLWRDGLDLAAIGTVADVVPLLGENRVWASLGLARLNRAPRPGIAALLRASATKAGAPVDEVTIGFRIGPRLNAAGRMGDASRAVELLLATDPADAERLAAGLERENARRQAVETRIFDEAAAQARDFLAARAAAAAAPLPPLAPLVVAGADWHPGVVGIVASRLVEAFARPAIVFAAENGQLRGSGRTAGDFDLLAAIASASAETLRFGGHRKAAGVVVAPDRLDAFRAALEAFAASLPSAADGGAAGSDTPPLEADAVLSASALTLANAVALQALAPYGEGNPRPLFAVRRVRIAGQRAMGADGRHRRYSCVAEDGTALPDGVAFGAVSRPGSFATGDAVDLLFHLDVNDFNGTRSAQLSLRALRPSPPWRVRASAFGAVYRLLRDPRFAAEGLPLDATAAAAAAGPLNGGRPLSGYETETVLAILEESSLVAFAADGAGLRRAVLLPAADRVKLEGSPTYRRLREEGILEPDA